MSSITIIYYYIKLYIYIYKIIYSPHKYVTQRQNLNLIFNIRFTRVTRRFYALLFVTFYNL